MARHTGNAALKRRAGDTALKRPRRAGDFFPRAPGGGHAGDATGPLSPEKFRVFLRLLGGGEGERRASGFPGVKKSGFSPIFFFPGRKKILTSRRIYTIIFFEQGRSSGGSFTLLAALFSLSDSLSGQS